MRRRRGIATATHAALFATAVTCCSRARMPNAMRDHLLARLARTPLAMFGSCAWFFDDVAGVEPALMLRARRARALDLARRRARGPQFIERLAYAKSNDALQRDAAQVYRHACHARRARAVGGMT